MNYYEIDFGEGTDNDRICIKGVREPSIEEASIFCRKDEIKFGANVTKVTPITYEDACAFYDMSNVDHFPIFGAMNNLEFYKDNLRAALVAYKDEMTERSNHGIEGLPFEDWVEEDVDTTAKLIAEKKREEEAAKKAVEEEKEAIRKGMEELKQFYKDAGWEKAEAALDKIFALDPNYEVYGNYASACNVFHSGAWSVMCNDFAEVYDFYGYLKREAYKETISTPSDWLAYMKKGIPEAIEAWLKDADTIIAELTATKGDAK